MLVAARHAFRMHSGRRTTALRHVRHVARVSVQVQVVGSDTSGNVAGVANLKPRWGLPEVNDPRGLVRSDVRRTPAASRDRAVALAVCATGPQPATIGLLDLVPEPLLKRPATTIDEFPRITVSAPALVVRTAPLTVLYRATTLLN